MFETKHGGQRLHEAGANEKALVRKDGVNELQWFINRNVFPIIGNHQLGKLRSEHVEKIFRGVVKRGLHRSSVTLFAGLTQMFHWPAWKQAWKLFCETTTKEIDLRKDKILPREHDRGE